MSMKTVLETVPDRNASSEAAFERPPSPRRPPTSLATLGHYVYTQARENPPSNTRFDETGQVASPGTKPMLGSALWEDEGTLCFYVEARGVCVARRDDTHFINGTKLLNVAGLTRGLRDAILKGEKCRHVVKAGPMHLKGVWIPFKRALELANREKITEQLYPLFVHDIGAFFHEVHRRNNTGRFDCPRRSCPRKGEYGFMRKDHLTEHLRNFHLQDISNGRAPMAPRSPPLRSTNVSLIQSTKEDQLNRLTTNPPDPSIGGAEYVPEYPGGTMRGPKPTKPYRAFLGDVLSEPVSIPNIKGLSLDLVSRIRSFPLFLSAPDSFLAAIGIHLRPQLYSRHDTIIAEGDKAKGMYWLIRGAVRVTSRDGEITLAELRPGAFFGEIGILMDIPRTATIVATKRSMVVHLDKDDLNKELPRFPEVEQSLLGEAKERLAKLQRKTVELGDLAQYQSQSSVEIPSRRLSPNNLYSVMGNTRSTADQKAEPHRYPSPKRTTNDYSSDPDLESDFPRSRVYVSVTAALTVVA